MWIVEALRGDEYEDSAEHLHLGSFEDKDVARTCFELYAMSFEGERSHGNDGLIEISAYEGFGRYGTLCMYQSAKVYTVKEVREFLRLE